MKAAVVYQTGVAPVFADFATPDVREGEILIDVNAAAISHVVKSRAAGTHYSFDGVLPFVPGIDGVGTTADGQRVWFAFPRASWGSMAEQAPVALNHCIALPDELDSVTAAAMANPGMSAWAALVTRAGFSAGESVLVNGATGSAGKLAVQIARFLGAKKVIVTGRNPQALAQAGGDVAICLNDDDASLREQLAAQFASGIDVVVDYLWGASAEKILMAAAKTKSTLRYVQVGSLSGGEITLPGAFLRSAPIQLMGSGIGSLTLAQLLTATQSLFAAAIPGQFSIACTPLPLNNVAEVWDTDDSKQRSVFIIR